MRDRRPAARGAEGGQGICHLPQLCLDFLPWRRCSSRLLVRAGSGIATGVVGRHLTVWRQRVLAIHLDLFQGAPVWYVAAGSRRQPATGRCEALCGTLAGYVNDVHVDESSLQRAVGRLAQRGLSGLDLRSACEVVVDAMPALFGADGAGLLLVDDTHVLRYVASTDTGAQLLEAVQESTGRGPCVEALVEDRTVEVADVLEDSRWPDLGALLASNGVRAVLGVPVHIGGVAVGSLNVYAAAPRSWDQSDKTALTTIEALVDRVLTTAVLSERQEELIGQLQRALEARVVVERAVGVLMALEETDAADAFERIRRSARSARRSVREVAGDVLEWRKLP